MDCTCAGSFISLNLSPSVMARLVVKQILQQKEEYGSSACFLPHSNRELVSKKRFFVTCRVNSLKDCFGCQEFRKVLLGSVLINLLRFQQYKVKGLHLLQGEEQETQSDSLTPLFEEFKIIYEENYDYSITSTGRQTFVVKNTPEQYTIKIQDMMKKLNSSGNLVIQNETSGIILLAEDSKKQKTINSFHPLKNNEDKPTTMATLLPFLEIADVLLVESTHNSDSQLPLNLMLALHQGGVSETSKSNVFQIGCESLGNWGSGVKEVITLLEAAAKHVLSTNTYSEIDSVLGENFDLESVAHTAAITYFVFHFLGEKRNATVPNPLENINIRNIIHFHSIYVKLGLLAKGAKFSLDDLDEQLQDITPTEERIILLLHAFPQIVYTMEMSLEVHPLVNYLHELTSNLLSTIIHYLIIHSKNRKIALILAVKQVLFNAMLLLGIKPLVVD